MERDMNQSALPTMCRGGCGFYGSSATDGFCSKCFKDTLKRKQDTGLISPTSSSMTPKAVDVAASRLATAMESRVTANQASCSAIAATSNATPREIEKAESNDQPTATQQDKPSESSPAPEPPKQKNRCDSCRKRVGLTGFECRCGGMFCAIHRYSDMHNCSFDYQALGKEEIRKNNPVVKTEKVVKL